MRLKISSSQVNRQTPQRMREQLLNWSSVSFEQQHPSTFPNRGTTYILEVLLLSPVLPNPPGLAIA
jgi:hypothetical protein